MTVVKRIVELHRAAGRRERHGAADGVPSRCAGATATPEGRVPPVQVMHGVVFVVVARSRVVFVMLGCSGRQGGGGGGGCGCGVRWRVAFSEQRGADADGGRDDGECGEAHEAVGVVAAGNCQLQQTSRNSNQ